MHITYFWLLPPFNVRFVFLRSFFRALYFFDLYFLVPEGILYIKEVSWWNSTKTLPQNVCGCKGHKHEHTDTEADSIRKDGVEILCHTYCPNNYHTERKGAYARCGTVFEFFSHVSTGCTGSTGSNFNTSLRFQFRFVASQKYCTRTF